MSKKKTDWFVGKVIKVDAIGNYKYIGILLNDFDFILNFYTNESVDVGDEVGVALKNDSSIEVGDFKIIKKSEIEKPADIIMEGTNQDELIEYLKTVSYMNSVLDRVKSDPDKIDSNTLYEVYFAKDKIGELLENGVEDRLVKQEAEDMLKALDGIISLLGSERIKNIYLAHADSKSLHKEDRLKYDTEEGFNGKLERKLIRIKSKLIRLIATLIFYKSPMLIISFLLCKATYWIPKLAEAMCGPLVFDEARDITGELINSFGPNIIALSNIVSTIGGLLMGLIFIGWMMNIIYIGIVMSYKATGQEDGFVRALRRIIDKKVIELCDEYIKVVEVVEEYTIADRIQRNYRMLKEIEEDSIVLPRSLKIDLLNSIRRYYNSTDFGEKFVGMVLVEKNYDKYIRVKNQMKSELEG